MEIRTKRKKDRILNSLLILLILCTISVSTRAGVNLKNGNFYISYTDLIVNDDQGNRLLELTRTYNSKSTHVGWFGFGWGSMFETYLTVTPDKSAMLRMHGSGGGRYLHSQLRDEESVALMVDLMLEAARKHNKFSSEKEYLDFREKLYSSAETRVVKWNKFVKEGILDRVQGEVGLKYYSTACGCPGEKSGETVNYLEFTGDKYIYHDHSGREILEFDLQGKLTKIEKMDDPSKTIHLLFDGNKLTVSSGGYDFDVFFGASGFVDSMTTIYLGKKRKVVLKYNGKALVYAKDMMGNHYQYVNDESYNLTRVIYNPIRSKDIAEDAMYMSYEPKTLYIASIKYRDGTFETFEYSGGNDEYGTIVNVYAKDSTLIKHYAKMYVISTSDLGDRWTSRTQDIIDGDTVTVENDPTTLKPRQILLGSEVFDLTYSIRGVLKTVASEDLKFEISFNEEGQLSEASNESSVYTFGFEGKKLVSMAHAGETVALPLVRTDEVIHNKEVSLLHEALHRSDGLSIIEKDPLIKHH